MRIHQASITDAKTGLRTLGMVGVQNNAAGHVTVTVLGDLSVGTGSVLQIGIPAIDAKPPVTSVSDPWITRKYPDRRDISILPLHHLEDHTDSVECWCCPILFGPGLREVTPEEGRALWDDESRLVVVQHRSEISSENSFGDIPWMPSRSARTVSE